MNHHHKQPSAMHFKSAQIAGVELSSTDLAQINQYSLSPLTTDEIFAFKVSMAANEIDRDFEVFPRSTLMKLANLFIGKTVVKDHDHKSDNQIARIYGTELVESDHLRLTRGGEVLSELIAKCYMVRTSKNADLISEIQAGIRKEVSLGCRIGKAVCSICGTDNVKTYCTHFPGKQYDGKLCYFSLQDPQDAYELSFVAIPAQQHAGTVKSYGEKPCYQKDMDVVKQGVPSGKEEAPESHAPDEGDSRLMVNRVEETQKNEALEAVKQANDELYDRLSAELSDLFAKMGEMVALLAKNTANGAENALKTPENTQNEPENDANEPPEFGVNKPASEGDSGEKAPEPLRVDGDDGQQSTDVPKTDESKADEGKSTPPASTQDQASANNPAKPDDAAKSAQAKARLRALEMAIALQNQTK